MFRLNVIAFEPATVTGAPTETVAALAVIEVGPPIKLSVLPTPPPVNEIFCPAGALIAIVPATVDKLELEELGTVTVSGPVKDEILIPASASEVLKLPPPGIVRLEAFTVIPPVVV